MESHISFKWKSPDIISSWGKVGTFRILRKKSKAKSKTETEKQTNYYVVIQFQANVPFLHPLRTAETLLFFRCILGVKKGNIGLKWVNNSGREIISIQNNATLIDGINRQNTTSTSASDNNVINRVTIFISEKFKGSCEWYFKSDITKLEFDYAKKNTIENIHRQNT